MTETVHPQRPILRAIGAKNLLSFGPEGFRLELEPLNVLIGPNGSGKSNLFEVLGLLHAAPSDIAQPIRSGGGIRNWLWRRQSTVTAVVEADVDFPGRQHPLHHTIEFTELDQRFAVVSERIENPPPNPGAASITGFDRNLLTDFLEPSGQMDDELISLLRNTRIGTDESILSQRTALDVATEVAHLREAYSLISLYRDWQFGQANVLRSPQPTDVRQSPLLFDLSNLGMFLNRLRQNPDTKAALIERLSDAYEGLADFELNFQGGSVQIFFTEGNLAVPAWRLSDGSLRYLCLLALLLDPDPPLLIGIEEPELGIHPDLMPKIADLLIDASSRCQLVVTTHSDVLVDALSEQPDAVVVCEKHEGQTSMTRLESSDLAHWLEQYRLGQLWTSGELGGVRW